LAQLTRIHFTGVGVLLQAGFLAFFAESIANRLVRRPGALIKPARGISFTLNWTLYAAAFD